MMIMGRFTLTIGEIIKDYNIFDFEYNNNTGFTNDELQNMFIIKYRNREIAYETVQMWLEKFELYWKLALLKYEPLFNKVVDIWTTYKTTSESTQSALSSGENEMQTMSTPANENIVYERAPVALTKNEAASSQDVTQSRTTTRQNRSDVELYNYYVKTYNSVVELWLNEFNQLMLRRY